MKKIVALFFVVAISVFSFAQKTEWREQKEFHKVMSTTFHPAEEGNLQPVKTRSAELVQKAETWKNSSIPFDITDKKAIKKNLKKLSKDAKNLDKKVKANVSDDELVKSLTELHDTFHTIVGLCSDKDKHDHDH